MADGPVTCAVDGGVATVTMDDGKANVMTLGMMEAIEAGLDEALAAEPDVVVLAGRPGFFSAGYDRGMFGREMEEIVASLRAGGNLVHRLMTFPVPVVGACTGHAIAQGAFTLMATDSAVGTRGGFKIGLNEVAIGLTLPLYATEISRHRLAPAWFDHGAVTGALFTPDEARVGGFLDHLVDPADHPATVAAEAARLAAVDANAHLETKLRVRAAAIDAVQAGIDQEFPSTPRS